MNDTYKLMKLVFINVAILFFLTESLAVAVYYFENKKLKYTDKPVFEILTDSSENEVSITSQLHPYLGYLNFSPHSVLGRYKINNYGFKTLGKDYPFPETKNSDRYYIVGIFGGSVADQLFSYSKNKLESNLSKLPQLKGKEVHVLNFAQPGYKQPQQLQLMTYFLSIGQQFDLIINLDGFNEVVLGASNLQHNLAISMPSYGHMISMMDIMNQSVLDSQKIRLLAQISEKKSQLNALKKRIHESTLASTYLILTALKLRVQNQYSDALIAYDQLPFSPQTKSVFHLNPADKPTDTLSPVKSAADYWRDSSILMHKIASANEIQYLHVVQPNQYHSQRTFSHQESRVAIDINHIYRRSVIQGYPELIKRFTHLTENGVRFVDGMGIVDDETSQVYADSCCHFTPRGTEVIADFVSEKIIEMQLVQ